MNLKKIAAGALVLGLATASSLAGSAKNVILMISDGQGFNHVLATDAYTGSAAVYESFDTQVAMSTYSASNAAYQAGNAGYDPASMASNFNYAKSGYTDSAAAATAMYTGCKVNDGSINMTTDGLPVPSFYEYAAWEGKSMGAVTSVEITHATPASVYGHNLSRNEYAAIGTEGVYGSNPSVSNNFYDSLNYNGNFTVMMGAGHGDYDNNGNYNPGVSDKYAGGTATWNDIVDGAAPNGWTFVEEKADFEAIANGTMTCDKLLGFAQVNQTLQYNRTTSDMNDNVPTLATMTSAALNVLNQNEDGFTVMIEGGAVDWAGHGNNTERLIEEQVDFNNSVQAVVDWVEANSSWDETLLIVTADHETGYLMGDGSAGYCDVDGDGVFTSGVDYGYVADNGKGVLPGVEWHSGNHTNQLVPVYAKGSGSELLLDCIAGTDANLADYYGLDRGVWTGDYIENTSLFSVMMTAADVPEPTTLALVAAGGLAVLRRRRNK